MLHPTIAQQLAAERQRDLLDQASRHRQARTAQAVRSARPAANRTRPDFLRRVQAALTRAATTLARARRHRGGELEGGAERIVVNQQSLTPR
jgi:hypothetical protein